MAGRGLAERRWPAGKRDVFDTKPFDEPWLATPRTHMMERRGEGMPIILDNSTALSGKEPMIELFDDAELRLTVYAAQADAER